MALIRKRSSVIFLLAGLLGFSACSSESQKPAPVSQPSPATRPVAATQPTPTPQSAPAQAAPAAAPSPAASAGVIQTQETNTQGLVAELTECKRKDGVLTIKVRFRNTSGQRVGFELIQASDYDKFYVTADNKKYFILKDSEQQPLTITTLPGMGGSLHVDVESGHIYQWWAKYPAPPATVKSIHLFTPVAPPFDDIPITDQ